VRANAAAAFSTFSLSELQKKVRNWPPNILGKSFFDSKPVFLAIVVDSFLEDSTKIVFYPTTTGCPDVIVVTSSGGSEQYARAACESKNKKLLLSTPTQIPGMAFTKFTESF
jgi:hypothetical protein